MLLGARGWAHPGWAGSFYPDDLPEDWQLAYYSNEYNAVLLPAGAWQQADMATLDAWRGEVADDFSFYLEVPVNDCLTGGGDAAVTEPGTALLQRARALCTASGGFCVVNETQSGVETTSLLQAARQYLGEQLPIHVLTPNEALGASITGYYEVFADEPRHIIMLRNAQGQKCDLRNLRSLIEGVYAGRDKSAEIVLFFAGEPPAVDDMQNTRIIAELLGV